MSPHALYLVRMDVAHDLEPTFNDVYDKEHLPLLQAVPGIVRGSPLSPALADRAALPRGLRAHERGRAPERRSGRPPGRRAAGPGRSARTR